MLVFAILAGACAVFYAGTFELFQRITSSPNQGGLVWVVKNLAWMAPVILCGAIQYRKLTQDGAAGGRLWLWVIGTAFGAPVIGAFLMLMVAFALYGKKP